ncbi:hypothetical protein EN829_037625 [Mesorhizobium sp. M00.F.Ca.ET.186.01.1.1]|nr:hypothetical protein EN829_037625 [Mesorhizobium sp. M00.F.Ca.ET.186.01.1.1]
MQLFYENAINSPTAGIKRIVLSVLGILTHLALLGVFLHIAKILAMRRKCLYGQLSLSWQAAFSIMEGTKAAPVWLAQEEAGE